MHWRPVKSILSRSRYTFRTAVSRHITMMSAMINVSVSLFHSFIYHSFASVLKSGLWLTFRAAPHVQATDTVGASGNRVWGGGRKGRLVCCLNCLCYMKHCARLTTMTVWGVIEMQGANPAVNIAILKVEKFLSGNKCAINAYIRLNKHLGY